MRLRKPNRDSQRKKSHKCTQRSIISPEKGTKRKHAGTVLVHYPMQQSILEIAPKCLQDQFLDYYQYLETVTEKDWNDNEKGRLMAIVSLSPKRERHIATKRKSNGEVIILIKPNTPYLKKIYGN